MFDELCGSGDHGNSASSRCQCYAAREQTGALRTRPVMVGYAQGEMRVSMLGTARVRVFVAVGAMLLLAAGCTGGDGDDGTAATASPTVTAATASPTTNQLPAS